MAAQFIFTMRDLRRFYPPDNAHQFMRELEHCFSSELVHGSAFYPPHSLYAVPEPG